MIWLWVYLALSAGIIGGIVLRGLMAGWRDEFEERDREMAREEHERLVRNMSSGPKQTLGTSGPKQRDRKVRGKAQRQARRKQRRK